MVPREEVVRLVVQSDVVASRICPGRRRFRTSLGSALDGAARKARDHLDLSFDEDCERQSF